MPAEPWQHQEHQDWGALAPFPPAACSEPAQLSLISGGRSNGLGVQGGKKKWGTCERVGGLGVEALQSPLSWGDTGVQGLRMLSLHFAPPHKDHWGPPANPSLSLSTHKPCAGSSRGWARAQEV